MLEIQSAKFNNLDEMSIWITEVLETKDKIITVNSLEKGALYKYELIYWNN